MARSAKLLFFVFLAFVVSSCAPVKWKMDIANQTELVWPPPPNPVKASYLGEITSFVPTGKSLVSVLFGHDMAGMISKPVAIAVGDDGRVAIADPKSKGVHFYVPAKEKYKLITAFNGKSFLSPVSVAFDDKLNLYVSDSVLGSVVLFNENGRYVNELRDGGRSPVEKQMFLQRPTGIAYLPERELLYVADTMAHKVHIFNVEGQHLQTFGERGAGEAEFNMPTHLAVSKDGRVLVNDAMNFRLQLFNTDGRFLSAFGRHGDGSGDFAMPKGIAFDRWGVVYVAETLFDVIQLFNEKGEYLMAIGGRGTGLGEFWMPSGIFVDRNSRLYVCDTYNSRIQVFQLYHAGDGGGE